MDTHRQIRDLNGHGGQLESILYSRVPTPEANRADYRVKCAEVITVPLPTHWGDTIIDRLKRWIADFPQHRCVLNMSLVCSIRRHIGTNLWERQVVVL